MTECDREPLSSKDRDKHTFLTSNLGFLVGSDDSPLETVLASFMSTSAIFIYLFVRCGIGVKLCFGVRSDLERAAGQAGIVES